MDQINKKIQKYTHSGRTNLPSQANNETTANNQKKNFGNEGNIYLTSPQSHSIDKPPPHEDIYLLKIDLMR